jgi:hypothetical protein
VLKVQHKPIKRYKLEFKRKEQKKPKRTLVWRTGLSDAPPDRVWCTRDHTCWTPHLWVSEAALRYNSPDFPVCQAEQRSPAQRSTDNVNSARTVRAESEQRQKAHRTVNSSCLVPPSCQSSNGRNRQNPNSWVTWLVHRTVSGAPINSSPPQRLFWWLGL